MRLNIVLKGDEARLKTESFIHDMFSCQYGADIQHYLPWLLNITNEDKKIVSALGLNGSHSNSDALFLEQYLTNPIEEVASDIIRDNIYREDIVEVGNLAANSLGGSRELIYMLTAFLHGMGYKWVAFTAPPLLINSFSRLNLPFYHLADATLNKLDDNQTNWGSYYDNHPQVVIGSINAGYEILKKNLNLSLNLSQIAKMWQRGYDKGYCYRAENKIGYNRIAA